MSITSVYEQLKHIGDNLYRTQKENNIWRDTPLESINSLHPDPAGKVGEQLIQAICAANNISNINTGDKNSKDGTYDQQICIKKVEIKRIVAGFDTEAEFNSINAAPVSTDGGDGADDTNVNDHNNTSMHETFSEHYENKKRR